MMCFMATVFRIPIDRSTIRKNPNAGKTTVAIPGRITKLENGSYELPEILFYTTLPAAEFYFDYVPTQVQCSNCFTEFLHTALESDDAEDGGWSSRVCPKCGMWDCCELKFENLNKGEDNV